MNAQRFITTWRVSLAAPTKSRGVDIFTNTAPPHRVASAHSPANAALIAEAPAMLATLRKFVNEFDNGIAETTAGDPGCDECTSGTVPNSRNTGLCAYHGARAIIRRIDA